MQTFYKRLLFLIDNKGFKNINDFALNGLKYDSSSKLSRLKDGNKKPSFEILEDIANKFEDLNLRWFILGDGDMCKEVEIPIMNKSTDLSEKIRLLEDQNNLLKENMEQSQEILKLYKEKIEIIESRLVDLEQFNEIIKLKYAVELEIEKTEEEIKKKSINRKY